MENEMSNLSETQSNTFMNVLVDYAFKRIFGTPHNKSIQMSMLNAFLQDYIGEIKDLELLQTEQLGILPNDKKLSYDVYAKEGNGRRFLIEMQREGQTFYSRRAIAYVSRAVSNELKRGDSKYSFPDIISLNFLEHHHAKIMGGGKFLQRVMLKNEDNEIFSEKIMFFFVDLSIFASDNAGVDFGDPRQKWAYYIRNIGKLSESDVRRETGIFREFVNECRMSNLNETEMKEYKKSIMEYEDVQDACVAAKEDGFAEGEAKGKAEGLAEGEARGEEKKAREIALELLKKKIPVEIIYETTGLTEDEIRHLQCQ